MIICLMNALRKLSTVLLLKVTFPPALLLFFLLQKAKEILTESNIPHGNCVICLYGFKVCRFPSIPVSSVSITRRKFNFIFGYKVNVGHKHKHKLKIKLFCNCWMCQ